MLEATLAPAGAPSATQRTAAILSVSTALPSGRLTSADLASQLGLSEAWILSRTGIRERRQAGADERLSDYATRAGDAALARAGVPASELDLVIVATMTQDELTPNTAPLVAHGLGAVHAGAFDVGAACTAFLSGLALGAGQIESSRAELVLLVGADFITRITDYDDKRTAPLFATPRARSCWGAERRAPGRSARSCSAPTARTPTPSAPATPSARSGWTVPRCSATRWRG